MNSALFFEPVSEFLSDSPKTSTIADNIFFSNKENANWQEYDIAIFTIDKEFPELRKTFYSLKKGSGKYKIIDLGTLRAGLTNDDTNERLAEICKHLLDNNILPFIIGEKNSNALGQFMGFEGHQEIVDLVNIDASFDLEEIDPEKGYLNTLFETGKSFIGHYAHLAHQSYLVNQEALNVFEKLNFEGIRLGDVRKNMEECEPITRASNMLVMDVCAIKHTDFPANNLNTPFGLTGEEACQLFWYAGLSNRLKSVGLYGFDLTADRNNYSSFILSTMMWYFIEGYYTRLDDMNFESDSYFKYIIPFDINPHEITFFKHKTSGKWWMLIDPELRHNKRHIIPCSYQDYLTASSGELPDRWMKASSRIY